MNEAACTGFGVCECVDQLRNQNSVMASGWPAFGNRVALALPWPARPCR